MENNEKCIDTMSGMWGLWDYVHYQDVASFDDWEKLFCEDEDIEKQIAASAFVPVYIHSDGCCQFRVKVDSPLSERETKYLLVQSEEYLFHTDGRAVLTGIENIGCNALEEEGIFLELAPGDYAVSVCLIEWDKEPGMTLEDDSPAPDALPDFVVLIRSGANAAQPFRQKLDTFDTL